MEKYILICSCFGQEKRATEAFSIMFPNQVLPEIVKGRDKLYKLGKSLDNDHIIAISKLSGKFAYYVELDDGKITKEIDLVHGRRTA